MRTPVYHMALTYRNGRFLLYATHHRYLSMSHVVAACVVVAAIAGPKQKHEYHILINLIWTVFS